MAKSVRVQFEDGTSHIYDNVPDDVDANAVESRAQEEFGKTVLTAHSPNQGAAPQPQENAAPTFAQYSTLPTSAGQLIGAAQIPIQIAAEHPYETGAAIGLYKAGQVANAYVGGKQAEAQALNNATAVERAKEARIASGGAYGRGIPNAPAPTAPINPNAGLYAGQGANIPPVQAAQQTAQTATQAAEQGLAQRVREAAASKIAGMPMLATAGRIAGKVLPGAGAALGGMEAYNRAQQGDYGQAALAGIGGLASFVPVVGTGVNLAATGINAAIDYNKYLDAKRKYEEQQKAMRR